MARIALVSGEDPGALLRGDALHAADGGSRRRSAALHALRLFQEAGEGHLS